MVANSEIQKLFPPTGLLGTGINIKLTSCAKNKRHQQEKQKNISTDNATRRPEVLWATEHLKTVANFLKRQAVDAIAATQMMLPNGTEHEDPFGFAVFTICNATIF